MFPRDDCYSSSHAAHCHCTALASVTLVRWSNVLLPLPRKGMRFAFVTFHLHTHSSAMLPLLHCIFSRIPVLCCRCCTASLLLIRCYTTAVSRPCICISVPYCRCRSSYAHACQCQLTQHVAATFGTLYTHAQIVHKTLMPLSVCRLICCFHKP